MDVHNTSSDPESEDKAIDSDSDAKVIMPGHDLSSSGGDLAELNGQSEKQPMMPFQSEDGSKLPLDSIINIQRPLYNQSHFDESFGLHTETVPWKTAAKKYLRSKVRCSGTCLLEKILKLLPFITVLQTYQWKKWIFADLVAGLSVGSVHLPQGMGFAILTSVPAVYGLYSSLFPVFIYFFFGTSHHISVGTMAVTSLMIGEVVNRETESWSLDRNVTEGSDEELKYKVGIAMSMSLMVGLIQVAMSFLNLGILATYMSTPFVGGFLTGAAFHIVSSQIPSLLGLKLEPISGMFKLPKTYIKIIENIADTQLAAVIIAVICFTFLIIVKGVINERFKHKLKIPIPAELLLVILATLVSHFAKLESRFDVRIIGEIPKGIPKPEVPTMDNASNYIVDSFLVAVVSFAVCISMAKMFSLKYKYKLDTNQEMLAYGLMNGVGSFLHCFAGAQAPPRTLIHDATGGKTLVGSLFSCIFLLVVCLALGPLFRTLPMSALACIITVAIFPLFKQFLDLKMLWKINKYDFVVWLSTWATAFLLDLSFGLAIGLVVNIFLFLLQAQMTKGVVLGQARSTELYPQLKAYNKNTNKLPGIDIFQFNSPLFFATVDYFKQQLMDATVDLEKKVLPPAEVKDIADTEEGKNNTENQEKNSVQVNGVEKHPEKDMTEKPTETSETTTKAIIVDCAGITYIDVMGAKILEQLKKDFLTRDIRLILANCRPCISKKITAMREATPGGTDSPPIPSYPSVHDAVSSALLTTHATIIDYDTVTTHM